MWKEKKVFVVNKKGGRCKKGKMWKRKVRMKKVWSLESVCVLGE